MSTGQNVYQADPPAPLPARRVDGTIWHYTTPAGLIGIVGSGKLQASNVRVMNDTAEMLYGLALLREVWAGIDKSGAREHTEQLVNEALEIASGADVASRLYVVCASKTGDMMVQWLSYANPAGYAIEMDAAAKWRLAGEYSVNSMDGPRIVPEGWYDVEYDVAEQRRIAAEFFEWVMDADTSGHGHPSTWEENPFNLQGWRDVGDWVAARIQVLIALFKDPAFAQEQEVRYIAQYLGGTAPQFKAKPNKVVPYMEIGVLDETERQNQFPGQSEYIIPIVRIVCGPNCADTAPSIVTQVLGGSAYDWHTPVEASKVPRLDI